jgi:hypothetical protein
MTGWLGSEDGGAFESFMQEYLLPDDDFCSFVEALACPDNAGPCQDGANKSAAADPAANLVAPKRTTLEDEEDDNQLRVDGAVARSPWSCLVTEEVDSISECFRAASPPAREASVLEKKLVKNREKNRKTQKAYRERFKVRCCLFASALMHASRKGGSKTSAS